MRRTALLALLALALWVPSPGHSGQLSIVVYPESASEQGNALGLYEQLERELGLTVTVSDAGSGAVRNLALNPLEPSSPASVEVTGPITVIAAVSYSDRIVARISVWPAGEGAFSSVNVPEGRLEISSGKPRAAVPGEGSIDVECPITVTLRSGQGTITVKLKLHVRGTGIKGVAPPKRERPRPLVQLALGTAPWLLLLAPTLIASGILLVAVIPSVLNEVAAIAEAALSSVIQLIQHAREGPGQAESGEKQKAG